MPLHHWYKKARNAKIETYLATIEETSAILNAVYFEVSSQIK